MITMNHIAPLAVRRSPATCLGWVGRASNAGDSCEARWVGRASNAGDSCEARGVGRASNAGDSCEARGAQLLPALVVALILAAGGEPLQAQDPFAPMAPPSGSPFGGGPATTPFGATPPPATAPAASPAGENLDPIVQKVLEQNPQTLGELMRAVRDLTNLGRADLVKQMIDKINKANPDANQMADLEDQWGAGLFMRLALEAPYAPEGRLFAQKVMDAAKARRVARPRLDQLANDIVSDDATKRRTAISELRRVGEAGFPSIISVLSDASRVDQQEAYVAAVAVLGEYVEPAMVASLTSGDETLQVQAMRILAARRADEGLPWILGAALGEGASDEVRKAAVAALQRMVGGLPSKAEAIEFLTRRAEAFRTLAAVGSGDASGNVTEWSWDPKSKAVVQRQILARDAGILREERVAKALFAISPEAPEILRRRLMTAFAAAKVREGIDSKIANPEVIALAKQAGPSSVVSALAQARKQDRTLAALGAAEMLGELDDASVMYGVGRPSVLSDSLNDDSPRVRFAALEAIMKLDPIRPFWGASVAMKRMYQSATATGERRALVGHTKVTPAQTWAGMLTEIGIEADVAVSGRELARQAPRHVDYDFVLIPHDIHPPGLRETIQRLRELPTAKQLPIGILCPAETLFATKQIALEFDFVEAYPMPYTATRMYEVVSRLDATRKYPPMTPALRVRHGRQALGWLAKFAAQPDRYSHFDLSRAEQSAIDALYNPLTSTDAAQVLGKIATRNSQLALVNMASVPTLPLEMRATAVAALNEAVRRRGLLMVSSEVNQQYDRYNQSRFLPKATQKLLGEVLDIIENAMPKSALPPPPVLAAPGPG